MTEISDDELDALRQRRMAEMQKSREQNAAQEKAISEAKAQIESILRQILSADAWEQWNNAKLANQDNAFVAAQQLIRLAQGGKIKGKISKDQIRAVLDAVYKQTHREPKITRK
ncbi:TPA: hypothetical protein H1009_03870 [archaeon]|nr:hypothetical protein [Candidatus Naiadarchaeales archaeon SRR2090153.bin461]